MRNLKVLLALGGALVAAVAVACSSSSSGSPAAPGPDAGDDTSSSDDGSEPPASCIPLTASGLCTGAGLTCCLDLSAGLAPGTCVPQASCKANVQVACTSAATCGANQVCCADLGGDDGGALAALQDGGLGALGIDAAALMSDAGAAGLGAGLANLSFKVTCETSCKGSQIQACAKDSECVGGGSCVPLSQLTGDAGLGDAAAPAGAGMYISQLGMEMACVAPAGPPVEAGTDSGATTDAGTDAIAPVDAGVDAPAEAAP